MLSVWLGRYSKGMHQAEIVSCCECSSSQKMIEKNKSFEMLYSYTFI